MVKSRRFTDLERIFSDAHVKDLDFSEWDQRVTLLVLADHCRNGRSPGGRCPVLEVRFERVQSFSVDFQHLGRPGRSVGEHFQWLIDSPELISERPLEIVLRGAHAAAPSLRIRCEAATWTELARWQVDSAFPGWDAAGAGLARPGVARAIDTKTRRHGVAP